MLSSEPDLEVRAEAESSPAALDIMRRTTVDLAIVDIGLHGSANGIELTKSIKAEHPEDRKSTRLNSSHANISYAVFCLKKKTTLTSTPFVVMPRYYQHTP